MSTIRDIVNVQISRESARIAQQGFGIPSFLAMHNQPETAFQVTSPFEASTKYGANSAITQLANKVFGGAQSPAYMVVGKIGNTKVYDASSMTAAVTIGATVTEGDIFSIRINRTAISYTALLADDADAVALALRNLIVASPSLTGVVVSSVTTNVINLASASGVTAFNLSVSSEGGTITQAIANDFSQKVTVQIGATVNAGAVYSVWINDVATQYTAVGPDTNLTVVQNLALAIAQSSALTGVVVVNAGGDTLTLRSANKDVGFYVNASVKVSVLGGEAVVVAFDASSVTYDVVSALNAMLEEDGTWYGVLNQKIGAEANVVADAEAVAGAVQGLGGLFPRLYGFSTGEGDSANTSFDIDGSDIANKLNALGLTRTYGVYSNNPQKTPEAGLMGLMFGKEPGVATWFLKSAAGSLPDKLTSTQRTNLKAKNFNFIENVAGLNVLTSDAVTCGGEYIDVVVAIDYIVARISESVFATMASVDKIPYTEEGLSLVESIVRAPLESNPDIIVPESVVVTVPSIDTISALDKSARILDKVTFEATLTGAFHGIKIVGTLVD